MTPAPALPPWWLEEALAAEREAPEAPPLAGDVEADVAIVGGGYTGLWTAVALQERDPRLRVAVLEAEICGWGPSGRNGGFLHGYTTHLPRLRELLGDAGALELARAGAKILPSVRSFSERTGEDVWFRVGGYLKVSAAPAQDGALERVLAAAPALGLEDEAIPLSAEEPRCSSG